MLRQTLKNPDKIHVHNYDDNDASDHPGFH